MGIGDVPGRPLLGSPCQTPFCSFLSPNESLTSDLDGEEGGDALCALLAFVELKTL